MCSPQPLHRLLLLPVAAPRILSLHPLRRLAHALADLLHLLARLLAEHGRQLLHLLHLLAQALGALLQLLLPAALARVGLQATPGRAVRVLGVAGTASAGEAVVERLDLAGRRVLLVDGDLRRPRVAQLMGMDGSIGLTTVLVGRTKLEESIQKHKESGVHVLASGPTPPNPSEILQANATHDLLGRLRDAYDIVIIDAPPLLPVADAALLATAADGAIIVTRHGKTTRDQLEGAAHRLAAVGARTFGVVLNMAPKRFVEMNYYYYYAEEAEPKGKGSKRTAGSRRA